MSFDITQLPADAGSYVRQLEARVAAAESKVLAGAAPFSQRLVQVTIFSAFVAGAVLGHLLG